MSFHALEYKFQSERNASVMSANLFGKADFMGMSANVELWRRTHSQWRPRSLAASLHQLLSLSHDSKF